MRRRQSVDTLCANTLLLCLSLFLQETQDVVDEGFKVAQVVLHDVVNNSIVHDELLIALTNKIYLPLALRNYASAP